MTNKLHHLTAIVAERIFGAIIVLLLVGLVTDFIFVTNFLKTEAAKNEVLHIQSDATDNDIAKLKSADTWIKENQAIIKRTKAIVAESKLYQYQNQIIEDLDSYGAKAGTQIIGYSFSASGTTGAAASGTAPSPATPTTSAPIAPASPTGVSKAPASLNSITVNISFSEKVEYSNFLTLLRLLEQNVTRMQVAQVTLSPDAKQPNLLINPAITITVYTR